MSRDRDLGWKELEENMVNFETQWQRDLVCNAWEGFSWGWANATITRDPGGWTYPWEVPFVGGEIEIYDSEDGEMLGVLNKQALTEGWEVFKQKYPKHYTDVLEEKDDALTGDVYLQCCVMGEVVYG